MMMLVADYSLGVLYICFSQFFIHFLFIAVDFVGRWATNDSRSV